METQELRCNSCGAALHYEPGQVVITCSHCATEYAVDDGAAGAGPVLRPTGFAGGPPPYEAEVLALLRAGQLIEAVKVVRAHTGLSLRESKELVEALAARESVDIPAARNKACVLIVAALLFVVMTGIVAYFVLARVG
jgi:LSD1 subclass zinc finger protein